MNRTLSEILTTGTVYSEDGEPLELRDHISADEGRFLQELLASIEARVTLEIGMAYGISTLFICEHLERSNGARHIAIDPLQAELWRNGGLEALRRAGYRELVDFVPLPSELALPKLVEDAVEIDFAFVDGIHHFDHALVDFFYVDRILRRGGIVAFDDADLDAVRRLCRFVLTNRRYSVYRSLPPHRTVPRFLRRIGEAVGRLPLARRALKSDLVLPDRRLGLVSGSRCVALRKEGDDRRVWNFHADF